MRFNPRTHMGCDTQNGDDGVPTACFNPRTHMGCDILTAADGDYLLKFQSTHPHGVRLVSIVTMRATPLVSIHAPTWGATFQDLLPLALSVVSIHAPTWGATSVIDINPQINQFQSTHPHGVRLYCPPPFEEVQNVSIHAPTWGATLLFTLADFLPEFQSTHPHGVRHATCCKSLLSPRFQSTHPHGVRHLGRFRIYGW